MVNIRATNKSIEQKLYMRFHGTRARALIELFKDGSKVNVSPNDIA